MRTRERKWEEDRNSRFIKGNLGQLHILEKEARSTGLLFEVAIVQPGLSKLKVSDPILNLLGSTDLFLKKTTNANLEVICSD